MRREKAVRERGEGVGGSREGGRRRRTSASSLTLSTATDSSTRSSGVFLSMFSAAGLAPRSSSSLRNVV